MSGVLYITGRNVALALFPRPSSRPFLLSLKKILILICKHVRAIQQLYWIPAHVSFPLLGMGAGFSVAGKVEAGSIQVSDRVQIMPVSEMGACKGERYLMGEV